MSDPASHRYAHINLPHARTIIQRIARSLEALGGFGESGNGSSAGLRTAYERLEEAARPFDEDPPLHRALRAADDVAERARELVALILQTPARGDRLGQNVRNLFECLGLGEEGAALSVQCGERSDSPLR